MRNAGRKRGRKIERHFLPSVDRQTGRTLNHTRVKAPNNG